MRVFLGKRLRTKLILLFLISIMVSVAFVGTLCFIKAKSAIEGGRIEALESIAELKTTRIEEYFHERKSDIRAAQGFYNIMTNLPFMCKYANDRANPEYISAKKMLDDQLLIFKEIYNYENVMLVSPQGKIVYRANESLTSWDLDSPLPDPDGKGFAEGKKGIYLTEIFLQERANSKYRMFVTAPACDSEDTFLGVIVLEIDMNNVYDFIQSTTGLGETGETLIGKKIGDKVIFMNPLRHDKDAALKRMIVIGSNSAIPVQESAQGINGSGTSVDYRGKEIIAVWRYIPSLDWGLVSKIDTSEAFAATNSLALFVSISGTIICGLAALIGWLLSRTISKPIMEATQEIATITAEIATASSQHEQTAMQQSTSVNETNTTMTELDSSARKSTEQADSARSATKEALDMSQNGLKTVEKTLEGMNSLKDKVGSIAENILHLSEQIGQIGSITRLVTDLANQTNLLALNAAVEAARAGEHGRGFSVVAVEIRKLAEESKKSAEKINNIVLEIQKSTNSTVMVTEEGTKTVEKGMVLAHQTGDAFKQLVVSNESVAESVQQILLNVKQQASATKQVAEAMSSIQAGAQQTSSGVKQTREGIQNLNKNVESLKEMV